jgi:hypothetical protein
MNIEKTQAYGFEAAIRAMRHPKNSYENSDSLLLSQFESQSDLDETLKNKQHNVCYNVEGFILGDKDKTLSQKLSKAGGCHRKHLRFIMVWSDWTLPRFVWQQVDTYSHITQLSCSTMHTLLNSPIISNMFDDPTVISQNSLMWLEIYRKQKDKIKLKHALPEGFLQKRTICTNYETLYNVKLQRENHELPQWHTICKWIDNLPYFLLLTNLSPMEEHKEYNDNE